MIGPHITKLENISLLLNDLYMITLSTRTLYCHKFETKFCILRKEALRWEDELSSWYKFANQPTNQMGLSQISSQTS